MPDLQQSDISIPNSGATPDSGVSEYMTDLLSRLKSESAKTQLQLIQELEKSGEPGLKALMSFLSDRCLGSLALHLPVLLHQHP